MHFTVLQLCVSVITWNVNSQFPNSKTSVYDLLGLENEHDNYQQNPTNLNSCNVPDLYVIGLQEVNSKASNIINRLFKDDAWMTKFRSVLSYKDYVIIKTEQMQGLFLVVFVKRKHLLHLRNIEAESTKTGIGGLWGNKGAISVRLNLYGNSITFINAHLPAHDDQLDKRISDYNTIIDQHHYHVNHYRYIFDHDYVFWFGDLNFRLSDTTLQAKDIRNMIQQGQLEGLYERDQLNLVRREHKAFHQFNEETPKFNPTFKFHLETSEYNMKRRPAWTDRILYRIKEEDATLLQNFTLGIEQLAYESHPEYKISDHKPVSGKFKINLLEDLDHRVVEFSYIPVWKIGEENLIQYTVPDDFAEQEGDWIGIFPNDYSSLNDYLAYQYASQSVKDNNIRYLKTAFSDNINIVENRDYILLYFQNSGVRSINSVSGISNVFKAE